MAKKNKDAVTLVTGDGRRYRLKFKLAKMHLDDFAGVKKRVAAAEAALATIFGMYNNIEQQDPNCKITRIIRWYYDKYPFPVEGKKDE